MHGNDADAVRDGLTPDHRLCLAAIVEAPEAWISIAALELAGATEADVDELVELELVVRWWPNTGNVVEDLVTLTSWGAFVWGVEIDERMEVDEAEELEVPYWVKTGDASTCVILPRYRPWYGLGYRLPFPEGEIEDPIDDHKYVLDEFTGEPIVLWGRPIPRKPDRRRRGRAPRHASA